jgi:hypothetical protein
MPRVVRSISRLTTGLTTAEANLLASTTITAGSNANGVPISDADSYAIVVANTGAQNMTVKLYLSAGEGGLREQSAVTATVNAGASWSYQLPGNSMRFLALTGASAASTTNVRADFNATVAT